MVDAKAEQPAWEAELYRLLVENTRDYAVFVLDLDGRVLTWNPAAQRVLGYAEAEIVGQSSFIIFSAEDRARGVPEKELRTALAEGRAEDDRWHVRRDGSRFWASGVMVRLTDETGRPRALAKVMRDYTEARLTAEKLREEEERLRVAVSAARMGTWLWRVRTNEQILDPGLRRLMGLGPEEEVMTLDDFLRAVQADDRDRVRAAFERCLREGEDFNVEFRVAWPDGSKHWLRDQGQVFPGPDGHPLFMAGACLDVTERRRAEEALREADRRKDEFLAMLAHELRNPLAPIRNAAQIVRMAAGDEPTLRWAGEVAERQVQHLTRLVDDLLDVSRFTRGQIVLRKEPTELAAAVARAVETARPAVEGRRQHLSVALPPDRLRVEADPVRLAQVVGNLLNNATKFTPEGGHIWLTAGREGGLAVLRVRDTGLGIPADMLSHVFDLFTQVDRTLDRSQGGLGIGLTLVKSLVELHGGSVEAHSDGPNRGSEFVIRLPLLPEAPPPEAAGGGGKDRAAPAPRRRVLVVEDNADAAESLVMILKLSGHEVRAAHDGPSALEEAATYRPEVVLLDIGLPRMDGYEVARRLRQEPQTRRALLVALTGYGRDDDRRRSEAAGFDYHLVKPVDPGALQELLASSACPH